MMVVGLTGGIGSGKTTVAKMFASFGVPIYIADDEAKKLMNTSIPLKKELTSLLGEEAYDKDGLNRPFIAEKIFNNEELLQKMNAIVHPKVGEHFKEWVQKQETPYCIKEVAILFENGSYKQCDYTILVTAPKEEKISRLLSRDSTTREQIEARMANQWEDDKKSKLADFIIENTDLKRTSKIVKELHETLVNRSKID